MVLHDAVGCSCCWYTNICGFNKICSSLGCRQVPGSSRVLSAHLLSCVPAQGWPQPFQVYESTMAASKRQAQGKKSKVRSLGQCKAGRMDDLQCVQAYCSFIPTFNNPHTALRRRYSKRSLSHQRQRFWELRRNVLLWWCRWLTVSPRLCTQLPWHKRHTRQEETLALSWGTDSKSARRVNPHPLLVMQWDLVMHFSNLLTESGFNSCP